MSDKREGNEFPFVSCVFRWFWRDLVKCYVSVQVTYLLDLLCCPEFYKSGYY